MQLVELVQGPRKERQTWYGALFPAGLVEVQMTTRVGTVEEAGFCQHTSTKPAATVPWALSASQADLRS